MSPFLVGLKTPLFGGVALVALLLGMWMLPAASRVDAYTFFASAVAAIALGVAGKASVDALAASKTPKAGP